MATSPDSNSPNGTPERATLGRKLVNEYKHELVRIATVIRDMGEEVALCDSELHAMEKLIPESATGLRTKIEEIDEHAAKVAHSAQSLVARLYPPQLRFLGLAAAMRSVCREFSERHKIPVNFSGIGIPSSVPEETSIFLFRLLQKTLSKITRLGGLRTAEIKLNGSPELQLEIQTSGGGFHPEIVEAEEPNRVGSTDLIQLVGGSLSVTSNLHLGTDINIRIPLP